MDEIEMLRRYGARAATGSPPDVDVAGDVLATLRREGGRSQSMSPTRPLVMLAAAGWLVAVTCGFFGQQAWTGIEDPLGSLVSPFLVALQ